MSPGALIRSQACQAEHWKGVAGQAGAAFGGEMRNLDPGGNDGRESDDPPIFDCDIRRPDVVLEPILPGVTPKEAGEFDVPASEAAPVVFGVERADRNRHETTSSTTVAGPPSDDGDSLYASGWLHRSPPSRRYGAE